MELLIHKNVLGTELHLLTDPEKGSIEWRRDTVDDVWVVGDPNHVGSVEALLDVLGKPPLDLFPKRHLKAFRELCAEGTKSQIPWRWVLGDEVYMNRINSIIQRSRDNVCALEESNYDQTYKTIRKFLLELKEPLVDVSKLARYIKTNEKGMTVEASLRSFAPANGRTSKIKYDQAGTATGRLTVKSGPRILTLPARHRDILKAEEGCEIVQIDLVSAEPRTALYVAGKDATGDVYEGIARDLNLDVSRDVVKVASLSALYGAGSFSLSKLLGSKVTAKRVINRLRDHFGVARIESQLTHDMKVHGHISNLFGRKLMTRPDEIQKAYSHFMQSTTSDAAIVMFSIASKTMKEADDRFMPHFVIHDAMVCQVSSDKKDQLASMTKHLELTGVGLYETKMSPISDS